MSFLLVPKSVTLNDLERPNGLNLRYFNEFAKHAFQLIIAVVIALTLRYFTEFGSFGGPLCKSG